MNKIEKIDRIYEVVANKELSFGCKVKYFYINNGNPDGEEEFLYMGYWEGMNGRHKHHFLSLEDNIKSVIDLWDLNKNWEIIGHSVMIGDILKYIDEHHNWINKGYWKSRDMEKHNFMICAIYMFMWKYTEPIEKQKEDTIDYIYNLLP